MADWVFLSTTMTLSISLSKVGNAGRLDLTAYTEVGFKGQRQRIESPGGDNNSICWRHTYTCVHTYMRTSVATASSLIPELHDQVVRRSQGPKPRAASPSLLGGEPCHL